MRANRVGVLLAGAAVACGPAPIAAPSTARAAAQLSWSAPRTIEGAEGRAIASISCPSASLCVAVSRSNRVFSGDPLSGAAWSARAVSGAGALDSVSCASVSLCVAVDESGEVASSTDPAAGAWTSASAIDGGRALSGVSCPTTALCVAVDRSGNALSSVAPAAGGASAWSAPASIDGGAALSAVSCTSEPLCVAVGAEGSALASVDPTAPIAWRPLGLSFSRSLSGVSCATASLCVAVGGGDVFASADAGAGAPTWSATAIDATAIGGISCVSSGLCVAVDEAGRTLSSDDAAGFAPGWTLSGAPGGSLTAISCVAEGFCVAGEANGRAVAGSLPPPTVSTGGPSAITQSSATVSGTVNPRDAPLTSCRFEYGPTSGSGEGGEYGQSAPCEAVPGPGSAPVSVSAQLSGLSAARLYHYRVVAASATGEGVGADGTFTTAAPSTAQLVHPAPYITGIPANGDRLACNPGVPHSSTATLAYSWWRDASPIAGAQRQLYRIGPEDASRHLQCEVTATNAAGSASARSQFVTVPAEGVPAAAGETTIGVPRTSGGVLRLPVACSPQADPECTLQLRLTAVETLRGRRLVAVSARMPRHRPPKARSLPVTLLARKAFVPAGRERVVSMRLGPAGRRLIAKAHRLPAQLTVEGTVIGVLSASLARERVTFVSAQAHVGRRAAARIGVGGRAAARIDAGGSAAAQARRRLSAWTGGSGHAARAIAASNPKAARTHAARAGLPLTPTVLTPTPYMGWDTYLALGPRLSESAVLEQASRMISDGLLKDGYDYLWLDVGWWQGQRSGNGEIAVDRSQWPHGMRWLTATLHRVGMRVGIYTDAGAEGCGGPGQGSYGHYQQDANTFASWGFDAVKVDFCGGGRLHLDPASAYAAFHAALVHNSSDRPMLLSICNFREPGEVEGEPSYGQSAFASYGFGPSDGNSWRTDTDIGFPGFVTFSWMLRNLDADAAHPEAAGPGHWNDPDYLAPDQGLTTAQFRAQVSMWAILAAPLMASDDLRTIAPASLQALKNREVIAVDQDPAGIQGRLLASSGEGQAWAKPLYHGDRALALLNRGSSPLRISTSAAAIGMPHAASYRVRNLWTHRAWSTGGRISAQVQGESAVLLRVSTAR